MDRLERFQCRRCGSCCRWPGYVRLAEGETAALAALLGISEDEFIQRRTRLTRDRRGLSLLENADGSCPFLEETPEGAVCRVQAAKPRQCRDFPKVWNFPGWEKECAGAVPAEEEWRKMLLCTETWQKYLRAPENYRYERSLALVKRYEWPECDAELYCQNNGPGTTQRVLKVFPKKVTGKVPAVAVPFYFPEAMLGFELESWEELPRFAGISMLRDLAGRGFAAATADAYHLTFLNSGRDRLEWARWQEAGEALLAAWPTWCGMGKLLADTRLLIDALADDPRVDAGRIGIAGHSLGGKMAFYAGCLDERVKVILASDFGIGWEQTNWQDVWYWGDRVRELRERGMDHSQLLSMAGGKPFLLLAGKFDNEESWTMMKRASGYEEHPENRVILNHASGHRPPRYALEAGYGFLEQFLREKAPAARA